MWENQDKCFFILSDAGKPIFASVGEDTQDIILLMGVASLIIARSENDVRTIAAGDTTIVFLLRAPFFVLVYGRKNRRDCMQFTASVEIFVLPNHFLFDH